MILSHSEAEALVDIVDSGASYHLVGKDTLSPSELKTIRKMKSPVPLTTAKGIVTVTQEARITVHMLGGVQVWACILPNATVSVLSQGCLVNELQFSFIHRYGENHTCKRVTNRVFIATPLIRYQQFLQHMMEATSMNRTLTVSTLLNLQEARQTLRIPLLVRCPNSNPNQITTMTPKVFPRKREKSLSRQNHHQYQRFKRLFLLTARC